MNNSNKDLIDLFRRTNQWIKLLESNNINKYFKNWAGLQEVQLAHISLIEEFIERSFILPKAKVIKVSRV